MATTAGVIGCIEAHHADVGDRLRRLFISYARENKPDVDDMVEHLTLMGYETWVDFKLLGGQQWWAEILERIVNTDVFIAVVSQAVLNSIACQRELEWAEAVARPILPVAVERLPAALPRRYAERHIVDYSVPDQRDRAAFALQAALGRVAAPPPVPDPMPRPPEPPLSYLTDLIDLVTHPQRLDGTQQFQVLQQVRAALLSVDPEERRGGEEIVKRLVSRVDVEDEVVRAVLDYQHSNDAWKLLSPRGTQSNGDLSPVVDSTQESAPTTTPPTHDPLAGNDPTVASPVLRGAKRFTAGPYDIEDFENPADAERGRQDFGAILMPMNESGQLAVELNQEGAPAGIWTVLPGVGRFTVTAYASETRDLWSEVATELAESLHGRGASVTDEEGPWGREVVSLMDNRPDPVVMRFIGIDGARWMIRATTVSPPESGAPIAEALRKALAHTVVRRGDDPLADRTALPLRLSDAAAEAVREHLRTAQPGSHPAGN